MPNIRLQQLNKKYGPLAVIHDIDLAMDDKEFTVLVGPSGFRFMGRGVVSMTTLLMRMMPPAVLLVPVFGIWTSAKLHRAGTNPTRRSSSNGWS